MTQTSESAHAPREPAKPTRPHGGWKLEDAKAKFSEVVRRARFEGPQRVSVRGRDAVVVIAADEFDRMQPRSADKLPFVAFMETLSGEGLDLTRDDDAGRDVSL